MLISILQGRAFSIQALWWMLMVPFILNTPSLGAEPSTTSFLNVPFEEFHPRPGNEFQTLCQSIDRPCGLEGSRSARFAGWNKKESLRLRKTKPKEILNLIADRNPAFDLVFDDELILFKPKTPDGEDLLLRRLGAVSIKETSSLGAAMAVLHQAGIRFGLSLLGRPRLYAKVDLELKDVTVRDALNAIVKADGHVMWIIGPSPNPKQADFVFIDMPSWRKSGVRATKEEYDKAGR